MGFCQHHAAKIAAKSDEKLKKKETTSTTQIFFKLSWNVDNFNRDKPVHRY